MIGLQTNIAGQKCVPNIVRGIQIPVLNVSAQDYIDLSQWKNCKFTSSILENVIT